MLNIQITDGTLDNILRRVCKAALIASPLSGGDANDAALQKKRSRGGAWTALVKE
jgi:hypothetical protein